MTVVGSSCWAGFFNFVVRLSAIKSNLAKFSQIFSGWWWVAGGAWPGEIVARICRTAALRAGLGVALKGTKGTNVTESPEKKHGTKAE